MGNKITVVVGGVPPSWNRFAGRQNSWEYREAKREWTDWVHVLASQQRPRKPFDRAHVSITYRFKNRTRRDPDNYSGKFIMDGLTAAGIIVDDSFRHVRLSLAAEPEPGEERTTIVIEEE